MLKGADLCARDMDEMWSECYSYRQKIILNFAFFFSSDI